MLVGYEGACFAALGDVQFVNGNQLGTRMLFQVGCGVDCQPRKQLYY